MSALPGTLIFKDGTKFAGKSYGADLDTAGEVVFATGMVGYPEGLTDPSYKGQILILTYPIIGSYGVPEKSLWESDRLQVSGLIVSNYIDTPSHFQSKMTLAKWFKKDNVPLLEIKDTRFLTKKIREQGVMLGSIVNKKPISFYDPDTDNLVAQVSTKKVQTFLPPIKKAKQKTIVFLDCGGKTNIIRCFLNRGVKVIHVPWDYDPFEENLRFDALFISNGPGNPKMADKTISTIKKALDNKVPTLGICLGNQLLALAAGGDTYKLKYGHRSQNQPCLLAGSNRCYITTQNHGYAVGDVPKGFKPWFINANDKTIEGIQHTKLPIMSVQFHPEAAPGPTDTEWIFDYFLEKIS